MSRFHRLVGVSAGPGGVAPGSYPRRREADRLANEGARRCAVLAERRDPPAHLTFAPHRPAAGLSAERITFQLARTTPRTTVVRASATATWLVARPATEVVPAAAHELDITRASPGHRPGIALSVTDPQLSAIRRLIDALPTVQPGSIRCPVAVPGLPRVTFIFRDHAGAPGLAELSETADVVSPTTACGPLSFTIGDRAQTPLLGGARLLRQVSRIVHRRLWLEPYAA